MENVERMNLAVGQVRILLDWLMWECVIKSESRSGVYVFGADIWNLALFGIPDDSDLLLEGDPRMQGVENFDVILMSLGLTDRLPIPDPVTFPAPDPLGSKVINMASNSQDFLSCISK